MSSGPRSVASGRRSLLRVVPIAVGGWRVVIDGLPPSDYASKQEACAEAEAYLAYQGRGGEIMVGAEADRSWPPRLTELEEYSDAAEGRPEGH